MGCCKTSNSDKKVITKPCPLCSSLGNKIHHLVLESVVKADVIKEVRQEEYFMCVNDNCDAIFYNEDGDRIFLSIDINMNADFSAVSKGPNHGCSKGGSCGGCN